MDEDDRSRPVLSLLFWLLIVLAFICIAAGAVVGVYGPKLFPPRSATQHALGKPPPHR